MAISERTPTFLYRTKVNNVSWKRIPYRSLVVAKMWFVQFIVISTGGGAMSKRKELIYTNVYNVKNDFIAPHEVNH